jgi:hypothetical protein
MRSPERQGRHPDDAARSGHHLVLAPTSPVGREKTPFNRQKAPSQSQKIFSHHGPKADFAELTGSGIPRAKTEPAADWQRNLVSASFVIYLSLMSILQLILPH